MVSGFIPECNSLANATVRLGLTSPKYLDPTKIVWQCDTIVANFSMADAAEERRTGQVVVVSGLVLPTRALGVASKHRIRTLM